MMGMPGLEKKKQTTLRKTYGLKPSCPRRHRDTSCHRDTAKLTIVLHPCELGLLHCHSLLWRTSTIVSRGAVRAGLFFISNIILLRHLSPVFIAPLYLLYSNVPWQHKVTLKCYVLLGFETGLSKTRSGREAAVLRPPHDNFITRTHAHTDQQEPLIDAHKILANTHKTFMGAVKESHVQTPFVHCRPLRPDVSLCREYALVDKSPLPVASREMFNVVSCCFLFFRIPTEKRPCCSSWKKKTNWSPGCRVNWWEPASSLYIKKGRVEFKGVHITVFPLVWLAPSVMFVLLLFFGTLKKKKN